MNSCMANASLTKAMTKPRRSRRPPNRKKRLRQPIVKARQRENNGAPPYPDLRIPRSACAVAKAVAIAALETSALHRAQMALARVGEQGRVACHHGVAVLARRRRDDAVRGIA